MNLLIIGRGQGSWIMRGQQLGAALGARVTSHPTDADFAWASVVILIKRDGPTWARKAHEAGLPVVWDALDFWRQPMDNAASEVGAHDMLRHQLDLVEPDLFVGATDAMAEAGDGICLPHHSWSGLEPTPARDTVRVVGYEGNPRYLGSWDAILRRACDARGWTFAINPPDLRAVDIFVSLRDGPWDGWMCRQWKSGVKVVNAIAAGRPILTQAIAPVRELQAPGSIVESAADLEQACDRWAPLEARSAVVDVCRGLAPSLRVEALADRYRGLLAQVRQRCAA